MRPVFRCSFSAVALLFIIFQGPLVFSQGSHRSHYSNLELGEVIESVGWDNAPMSQIMKKGNKKIIFFIDPGDCTTCIESVLYWLKCAKKHEGLRSALIMVESSNAIAQKLKDRYGIDVPCLADATGSVSKKFQIVTTPVFFILDEENKLLDFDKCGGRLINEARLEELVKKSPEAGVAPKKLSKVIQISLSLDGEIYSAGAIRDLTSDKNYFYAIDKTFRTVIQFDQKGVVRGVANSKVAGFDAQQPIQISIEHDTGGNVEVLVFDAAFLGHHRLYSVRFDSGEEESTKVDKFSIVTDSSFQTSGSFSKVNGDFFFTTVPYPALWKDSSGLAKFAPVYQSPQGIGGKFELSPVDNYLHGSLFKACNSYKGDPIFAPEQNPAFEPYLMKLSQQRAGLYFIGLNELVVLNSEKKHVKTIPLQLADFERSDCHAHRPNSAIFQIRQFENKLIVLYQKKLFEEGTDAVIRTKEYYLQILDIEGHALSREMALPDEAVPGKTPPVFALTEDGKLCFATKILGETGFAIYEIQ